MDNIVRTGFSASVLAFFSFLVACASVPAGPGGQAPLPTAPALRKERTPTMVLVSVDGLRWDFARAHGMDSLLKMAEAGAAAQSLIPVYPSKTFPNHYSIATGCYADQHGLVGNEFFDPGTGEAFAIKDRKAVQDPVWYGCDPIWNVVEKNGARAAAFFWVGSDAPVGGRRPWQWRAYDGSVPNEKRVDQALEWLKLPDGERPRLILLYFSAVDSAAHKHGPDSPEASEAARAIDRELGRLREGIARIGRPTNLIVVSDHGMAAADPERTAWIEDLLDVERLRAGGPGVRIFAGGPQTLIYVDGAQSRLASERRRAEMRVAEIEARLEGKRRAGAFAGRVWRRESVPERLHFRGTPRIGDLVIDMDPPWQILSREAGHKISAGNHGWDPRLSREMHGSFFAEGPGFKKGAKTGPFDNVDLYPALLRLLDLSEANAPNSMRLSSPIWKALAEPYALEEPKK